MCGLYTGSIQEDEVTLFVGGNVKNNRINYFMESVGQYYEDQERQFGK